MTTFISLFIILHFVVVGIAIEKFPRFFTTKMVGITFAYFFSLHVAFGFLLKAAPWLVDPR